MNTKLNQEKSSKKKQVRAHFFNSPDL